MTGAMACDALGVGRQPGRLSTAWRALGAATGPGWARGVGAKAQAAGWAGSERVSGGGRGGRGRHGACASVAGEQSVLMSCLLHGEGEGAGVMLLAGGCTKEETRVVTVIVSRPAAAGVPHGPPC